MPRIVDVMQELNLDKDTFSQLYEQVCGKKFTTKTTTISETNLSQLKKLVEKPTKKVEKAETKVLKTDEIGF